MPAPVLTYAEFSQRHPARVDLGGVVWVVDGPAPGLYVSTRLEWRRVPTLGSTTLAIAAAGAGSTAALALGSAPFVPSTYGTVALDLDARTIVGADGADVTTWTATTGPNATATAGATAPKIYGSGSAREVRASVGQVMDLASTLTNVKAIVAVCRDLGTPNYGNWVAGSASGTATPWKGDLAARVLGTSAAGPVLHGSYYHNGLAAQNIRVIRPQRDAVSVVVHDTSGAYGTAAQTLAALFRQGGNAAEDGAWALRRLVAYSTTPSAAQIAALQAPIAGEHGVTYASANRAVLFHGNSLVEGYGLTTPSDSWASKTSATLTCRTFNTGRTGEKYDTLDSTYANAVADEVAASGGVLVVVLYELFNSLVQYTTQTPAQIVEAHRALLEGFKTRGARTMMCTVAPYDISLEPGSIPAGTSTRFSAANAIVRGWVSGGLPTGVDAVLDVAALSGVGSGAYLLPDKIHWTAAGHAEVATAAASALAPLLT